MIISGTRLYWLPDREMLNSLDGKLIQSKDFAAKIAAESIFQIGKCSVDFGGNFEGDISNVRHWKRHLMTKNHYWLYLTE